MEIHPIEVVSWSWKRIRWGLILGVVGGLVGGIGSELVDNRFNVLVGLGPLFNGLAFGLATGLVIVLISGSSGTILNEQKRVRPNQGIWRSAQNGVLFGLLSTLLSPIVVIVSLLLGSVGYASYVGHPDPPANVMFIVFLVAVLMIEAVPLVILIVFLRMGGSASIQHLMLRLLLWHTKSTPLNYPHFLDYATERVLLRKVGGGYIFIHRLLLDYFASLKTSSSEEASAVSASLQKANEKG